MSWDYGDLLGRRGHTRTRIARGAKVFGIGLSRTGTSSLHAAFKRLGYRSVHYPPLEGLFNFTDACDAAADTTVAVNFKELDKRYPGSKFVFTVRDIEKWLASTRVFFERKNPKEPWKRELHRRICPQAKYSECR